MEQELATSNWYPLSVSLRTFPYVLRGDITVFDHSKSVFPAKLMYDNQPLCIISVLQLNSNLQSPINVKHNAIVKKGDENVV